MGLAIGLAAVGLGAWVEGVRPAFLWQPTAALVVCGGALGAVTVRRGAAGVLSALRAVCALFVREQDDEEKIIVARLAWLARTARREGVRSLEEQAQRSADPLVARGLLLAAEFADPQYVRAILERALDAEDANGARDAATLEAAGGYAPTFGILGAVLGLIHVLRALDQPGALGVGIAAAFIATIYGIGFANLILFPLASRLRERHESRMRRREALVDALVALAAQETPQMIAERFNAPNPNQESNKRRAVR